MNRYRVTTVDGSWYFEDGTNAANARRRFEAAGWNRDRQVARVELLTPELLREVLS